MPRKTKTVYICDICKKEFKQKSHYDQHKNKKTSCKPNIDSPRMDKQVKKIYKYIDLCAGTGAFSLVLDKYDQKCVFANDMVKEAEIVYKLNFPKHNFICKDLHEVDIEDIPKFDILTAGFSCQPFSISGLRKGFEDKRAEIFWKILEIIENRLPEIIILENVKNLVTFSEGKPFNTINEKITELGYYIKYKVLDTCKLTNIPQHRERIYIICFKHKKHYDNFNFDFDNVESLPIKDLLEDDIDDSYYYTDKYICYDKIKEGITKHINENVLYQYRHTYVRENKSNNCPTLTANMGGGGHNVPLLKDDKGIRKLTPRECFNFQGFPSTYKLPQKICDSKLYKLSGNAVTVSIVELLIKRIMEVIN